MNLNIDYDALFAYRFSVQEDYDLQEERDIIIRLKYYLLDSGYPYNNIPTILKEFYERFGINITLENITEAMHENPLIEFINNMMTLPGNNQNIPGEENDNNEEAPDNNEEPPDNNEEPPDDNEEPPDNNEETLDNDLPPLIPGNFHITFHVGNQQMIHPFGNLLDLNNNLHNIMNNLLTVPQQAPQENKVICTLQDEEFNNLKTFTTLKNLKDNCAICMANMEEKEIICELPCNDKFHMECISQLLKNYSYKLVFIKVFIF
jgi:hypothetical protein